MKHATVKIKDRNASLKEITDREAAASVRLFVVGDGI